MNVMNHIILKKFCILLANLLHRVHPAIQIVGETALTFQPLSHIYGMMMCVIAISQEATHVIMPKFNLQQYIAFVEEFEVGMCTS